MSKLLRSVDVGDGWFGRGRNSGTYVHVGDLLNLVESFKQISSNPELREKNPEYTRGSEITLDLLRRSITDLIATSTYI